MRDAPVLDHKLDARLLNRLEIRCIAGSQRAFDTRGDGGDEAIRKLNGGALLSGCRLDGSRSAVVGRRWSNLFVLVQEGQHLLQLAGGSLEFQSVNNFEDCDARERVKTVLLRIGSRMPWPRSRYSL